MKRATAVTMVVCFVALQSMMVFPAYSLAWSNWGWHSTRGDNDCNCECSTSATSATQALFLTEGWGGYGDTEVISVAGVYPTFPGVMTLTAKATKPQNGTLDTMPFFFHGEFINGLPVYEQAD